MHEPYIQSLSSAHNGYLGLLAETGIIGIIPMMFFLVSRSIRVWQAAFHGLRVAQIGIAWLCGMAFISFFAPVLINFGNPTSIIQLMILLCPWSDNSIKGLSIIPPATKS
jgi:O-antigen ligase